MFCVASNRHCMFLLSALLDQRRKMNGLLTIRAIRLSQEKVVSMLQCKIEAKAPNSRELETRCATKPK